MELEGCSSYLTALPEHVLCSIISFLPLREAIATSVLSRKWKNRWHSLPRLDIDPREITIIKSKNSYDIEKAVSHSIPIIRHVLNCQTGNLESYQIVHCSKIVQFSKCLVEWIEYLKERRKIQKLVLSNMVQTHVQKLKIKFTFPDRFFRCNTLHSLELENYTIKDATPFQGCANLVTIGLKSISTDSKTLNKIISICTCLENLTIDFCYGIRNLEICTTRLRKLDVRSLSVTEFKLSAEGLVVLAINDFSCSSWTVVIDCPNIRVFQAHYLIRGCQAVTKYIIHNLILDQCSGLLEVPGKDYNLSGELHRYSFQNLRELYISFDLDDIKLKILLFHIFSVSQHLHKLEITNQSTPSDIANPSQPGHISWDTMELFDCVSHPLRIVRIKGYTGYHLQIQFVSNLIKSAKNLERLVIQCDNKSYYGKTDIIKSLSLVPRASLNAHIEFN